MLSNFLPKQIFFTSKMTHFEFKYLQYNSYHTRLILIFLQFLLNFSSRTYPTEIAKKQKYVGGITPLKHERQNQKRLHVTCIELYIQKLSKRFLVCLRICRLVPNLLRFYKSKVFLLDILFEPTNRVAVFFLKSHRDCLFGSLDLLVQ